MQPKKNGLDSKTKASKQTFFAKSSGGDLEIYVPETPRVGRLMEKTLEHEKASHTLDDINPTSSSGDSCLEDKDLELELLPIIKKRHKVSHLYDSCEETDLDSPVPSLPRLTQSTSIALSPIELPSSLKLDASPSLGFPIRCEVSPPSPIEALETISIASSQEELDLSRITIEDSPKKNSKSHEAKIKTFQRKKRAIICSSDEESDTEVQESPKDALEISDQEEISDDCFPEIKEARKLAFQDELTFFNLANLHELTKLTCLTSAQADFVMQIRPFNDRDDLNERVYSKPKGKNIEKKFKTLIQSFEAVDELIKECKGYFSKLKTASSHHIPSKPGFLNEAITLKSYQVTGVNWLLSMFHNRCGVILADEMGLGKTCQVITMIGRLVEEGAKGPHLIVVPSSVVDNWLNEFERFCPHISVLPYKGGQAERADIYDQFMRHKLPDYDVVVTSYNLFSSNAIDRKFMRKMKFQSMTLDEAHLIKNPKSQANQNLMKLETQFRLLLTGTPLQNNLTELLTLLTFINPVLFSSSANEELLDVIFRSGIFDNKEQHLLSEHANELSLARINKVKKIMVPFILRRCKEQVLKDLPKKTEYIIRCPLNEVQRSHYSKELASARLLTTQGHSQLMSLSFKLRRVANHTMLISGGYHFSSKDRKMIADRIIHDPAFYASDKNVIFEELKEYADTDTQELCLKYKCVNKFALKNEQWMDSGKVDWLRKELPSMIAKGDRVLIFSQFTMILDILERVFETLGLEFSRIDGSTPVDERQDLIDNFNENTNVKIFLLSTRSGGCGINLTGANVVILHDIDHNPQNDRQAEARAHRVGQIRDVSVYKLVSESTIEERILAIGNAKLELHNSLSGDVRELGDQGSYAAVADSHDGEGDILQALREEIMRPL